MITPKLYGTLPPEERRYWHSHVFEVKSGMLIMPQPSVVVPEAAWEKAESKEMEDVVELYGKVFHLWQTDRGDKIPLGEPQLMTSFTAEGQFDFAKNVGDRDRRFGSDYKKKQEARSYIKEPELHPGRCCSDWPMRRTLTDADGRCRLGVEEGGGCECGIDVKRRAGATSCALQDERVARHSSSLGQVECRRISGQMSIPWR